MNRPQSTYATLASGLRLRYRAQGPAGAPWMVLLNGLLSDLTMWAGALPGLSERFRVLTFDSRGQGQSDAPDSGPYPTALLAQEAWELLDRLGVSRPWLVGLSNGSSMALELLAEHPGAFAGAVLTSSMPRIGFSMELKARHWAKALEVGGNLLLFDAVAPFLWGDAFLEARYQVLRAYHQVVTGRQASPVGNRNQILGILGWDIRPRLHQVKGPVLLLAGAQDLLTPPWKCQETAQGIPHARFEVVPGVGHAFPVEDPKRFVARVIAFVDAVGAGLPVS